MLRQLNLLPLLVIPIATLLFVSRQDIAHVPFLSPSERELGAPIVESFSMNSEETGKTYNVLVELPPDYAAHTDAYPVIYAISYMPGLIDYKNVVGPLLRRSSIPDVIVVQVSPPPLEGPRTGQASRWAEDVTRVAHTYKNQTPIGGKADLFTAFLEKKLIPEIETKYRTVKGDRCVAGWDLAALFVLDTALTRPELFKRYLAISPVANWGDQATIRLARQQAKSDYDPAIRLFMGSGSLDHPVNEKGTALLLQALTWKRYKNMAFDYTIVPNRDHENVVSPAAQKGLTFLYRDR